MEVRFKISIKLSETERKQIDLKTMDYAYERICKNDNLYYSGYSNSYNHLYFCSYSEGDNWNVFGNFVDSEKFEEEIQRFRFYLEYVGLDSNEIKMIIENEERFKIKSIQNLMNRFYNYESILKKSLGLSESENLLNENEIDNLNELIDSTDELPEDVIELSIEDIDNHKKYSPIDLSGYPKLVFKNLGLGYKSIKNYFQFVLALVDKSIKGNLVKKNRNYLENEKYKMRNLLIGLGFSGISLKGLRKMFLKNLSGDSAFKNRI